MSRQPTIFFFGVLFCLGLLIQIVTSVYWQSFGSAGETVFMAGQGIGELFYIFGLRRLFKDMGFFVAVTEFAICLILVDLYTIIFLNPFEISISKYTGFVIAVLVLIARIKSYVKNE